MDRRPLGVISADGLRERMRLEYQTWSEVISTGHTCRECRVEFDGGIMLKAGNEYVCYDCACPAPEIFEAPDQGIDSTKTATAESVLQIATATLYERGRHYASDSERNMRLVVELYNRLTGRALSVSDGWHFMLVLKMVRAMQDPEFKLDHYVDLAGYAALAAEEGLK